MDLYNVRQEMREQNKTIFDLNIRVAYYARVSTDKDEQLHSLSSQQTYFEKMIAQNPNWTLTRGYIDEGISATKVKGRESFLEMVRDAKNKRFDLLLTKEISRFARNTMDSLYYTQELLRNGVGVFFESDNINTLDSDAELRLTIMASIAQDETRKISERVRFGFKESIKKGIVLGNDNIWGYRKENGKLVIVPEEAKMVKEIFDMYANHDMGIRSIAKTLSEQGLKNSNGNSFSFSTIKGILINPKYKGYYCGNKTHKIDFRNSDIKHLPPEQWTIYEDTDAVPQIVSEHLWAKANRLLAERSAKMKSENKTSYQNKYPYSGKIVCSEHNVCYHHCVYKYKSGNKELWACKEYINGNGCKNPIIYTKEVDAIIKQVYNKILSEKDVVINDLLEIYKQSCTEKNIDADRKKVKTEISSISAKKDKLLDLVMEECISNSEFEQRNNAFNNQINKWEKELENLKRESQKSAEVKKSINSLRTAISEELDYSEEISKSVIDSFIDKIVVSGAENKNEFNLKIYLKLHAHDIDFHLLRSKKETSVWSESYI